VQTGKLTGINDLQAIQASSYVDEAISDLNVQDFTFGEKLVDSGNERLCRVLNIYHIEFSRVTA
jgi:hypothetical protein